MFLPKKKEKVIKMKSFIAWIGGKSLLAKKIISEFPNSFDRYIEVFGGGGSVLFAKDKHADLEVYNDANSDLVNLSRFFLFILYKHTESVLHI